MAVLVTSPDNDDSRPAKAKLQPTQGDYAVYSVQCTVYSVQCTVFSVNCTVHSVHCKMYSAQCTVYSVQCAMYSVHCTLYSVQCICAVQFRIVTHMTVEYKVKQQCSSASIFGTFF